MKQKELTNIYDDFKLNKTIWSPWSMQNYFRVIKVKPLTAKVFDLNFYSLLCLADAIHNFT